MMKAVGTGDHTASLKIQAGFQYWQLREATPKHRENTHLWHLLWVNFPFYLCI